MVPLGRGRGGWGGVAPSSGWTSCPDPTSLPGSPALPWPCPRLGFSPTQHWEGLMSDHSCLATATETNDRWKRGSALQPRQSPQALPLLRKCGDLCPITFDRCTLRCEKSAFPDGYWSPSTQIHLSHQEAPQTPSPGSPPHPPSGLLSCWKVPLARLSSVLSQQLFVMFSVWGSLTSPIILGWRETEAADSL